MKKLAMTALICFLFLFAGCAGTASYNKSLSEDMGSVWKETLLKERFGVFWSAFIKEDYENVYALYDPFFKAKMDKNAFLGQLGKIKYHDFSIENVKIVGNVANVTYKITYSMPTVRLKTQEFTVPKTTVEMTETWLYIYDNWYKEYYLHTMEGGIASY